MSDNKITPPPAEAGADEWDGTNLAGDIVERGIQKNRPEVQDALRWWFRWAHVERKPAFSQAEAARELGCDSSTYSKVFRGEYKNQQGLVLAPPAMMLSRIKVLRQQEADNLANVNRGRVKTPTVDEIWMVLRKAWNDRNIAFIFGESRLGKTEAGLWFRDENNHGATLYVDLQGCMGVQDIYRAFARALKLSPDTAIAKLMPRVYAAIDKTNFVIVDEFHHITYAYHKGSSNKMVNALKAIKDRCGCGMAIFSTNVAREEFTEGTGKEAKLLKQLWRRGILKLQLPDAMRAGDVRAFAAAYQLDFPAAPDNADHDTWAKLRERAPDFEAMDLCENIAYHHGVEHLVSVLRDGMKIAKKRSRELRWKDVLEAQAVYDRLGAKKAV
ncbi:MAG: ATP-binding protein [Opitutaceae bacterium]|nr:ATP-binding protein [Opitutaceae bacterium]